MYQAERGFFELGRGRTLHVTPPATDDPGLGLLIAAVEGLGGETVRQLRSLGGGCLRLAVTHHRARATGLANGGRPRAMSLALPSDVGPDEILHLSSAAGTPTGLLDAREASIPEVGGLRLARLGRLLPAIVSAPVSGTPSSDLRAALQKGDILTVTTAQIEGMASNEQIEVVHVSEGPVPLEGAEDARLMLFREANGILEHVAVLIGSRDSWPDPVPVRIHSACLTGDVLGSLRCDCGEQLRGSLRAFAGAGGGVLLYLAHEGRGIGLANKLRAYTLQQRGLDTVDADCTLGFGADERHYDAAVEMLRHLGIARVLLLTNNPHKVRAVRESGILVMDRQPLYGTLNRHNLPYVEAKANRAGHWLSEMLYGPAPAK